MKRIEIGLLSVFILVLLTNCFTTETTDSQDEHQTIYSQIKPDSKKSDSIHKLLIKIVDEEKAPGMIAAIISSDSIIAIASAGERKEGSSIAFTINDMVHLGSCTKAMTSTMLATLVAEGKLSWNMKLIDAIPELKKRIHSDYHRITLWQLLTHRAGIQKNVTDWGSFSSKEIKERRVAILIDNLQTSASYKLDEFHYSNFGYMIAACMAEQITGLSWEVLIKKRLFEPLGMNSVGFGAPNTLDQIDQPWGHEKQWHGYSWKPNQSDNPEALSPAGRVHCTIDDWAKFISLQIIEENAILDKEYLNRLIEPVGDHFYAGGWGVGENDWANGIMITHSGSNGLWYTSVVVTPILDRAFIVSTNSRDFGITADMCRDLMNKLIIMELDLDKN